MGSDETAITIPGGPWVIDVFDGNRAPSGPICLLFPDVDRLSDVLCGRSEVGWAPAPHAPILGASESSGSHCQAIHGLVGRTDERIGRNMLEAAVHAV